MPMALRRTCQVLALLPDQPEVARPIRRFGTRHAHRYSAGRKVFLSSEEFVRWPDSEAEIPLRRDPAAELQSQANSGDHPAGPRAAPGRSDRIPAIRADPGEICPPAHAILSSPAVLGTEALQVQLQQSEFHRP